MSKRTEFPHLNSLSLQPLLCLSFKIMKIFYICIYIIMFLRLLNPQKTIFSLVWPRAALLSITCLIISGDGEEQAEHCYLSKLPVIVVWSCSL